MGQTVYFFIQGAILGLLIYLFGPTVQAFLDGIHPWLCPAVAAVSVCVFIVDYLSLD